jgi:hypothetical protein
MNLVQPELVLATIGFALEWQSGELASVELQNSYANHDLFGNLSEVAALSNMRYVMGHAASHNDKGTGVADVVALAVAKAVPRGLRPPLRTPPWLPPAPPPLRTPPWLPPAPPVPPIVKRERQPDADDDDAETKRRGRRHLGNHSIASSSSASGGQAPLLSIDDMDMIHYWGLEHEATEMLKQLAAAFPSEKIRLISKLQKKVEKHEGLRNPSTFVIACCKNAMGQ